MVIMRRDKKRVEKMRDKELEEKLKELAGQEVLVYDDFGFVFNAIVPEKVRKGKSGYIVDEYDHRRDCWYRGTLIGKEVSKIKIHKWDK